MPPKASKRKAANGYKLPDPIPEGTIITGTNKKQFRLGKSIGLGGFGEIYLASEDISKPVKDDATLALKIEPHENGPLFVEMNFYIRSAQPQHVEEWKKNKNLKSFGMPSLRGHGSHVYKGEKYRFLIMDRYGKDLQKIFQTGKKLFTDKVSYNLALKVIDVLEFIHFKGYCHNDIKAQNMLLGYGRTKENDVYLVDFGLVSKYQKDWVHNEYKPDARKAHDGTIEYTSRDAHIGAHSRRSDLEVLCYNLVHWMSGDLPWMDNLTNPQYVHAQKKGYMNDVKAFLQRCFKSEDYPAVLEEFLNYTVNLDFDTEPDYEKIRKMFKTALSKAKYPLDGKIDFATPKNAPKKARKRKRSDFEDIDFSEEQCRKSSRITKNTSENGRVVSSTAPNPTPAASPTPEDLAINSWSWEKILCTDPELLIRQASRQSETEDDSPLALQHKALDEIRQKESLENPTDAMKEIMVKMEEREREREQMTWQQQLQYFNKKRTEANEAMLNSPNPLTPAMEEVIKMRQKRISVEIDIPITPEPSDSETDSDLDDCSSHEEYIPATFVKSPASNRMIEVAAHDFSASSEDDTDHDPFEFHEDEVENESIMDFRSCLNVVNTLHHEIVDEVDNSIHHHVRPGSFHKPSGSFHKPSGSFHKPPVREEFVTNVCEVVKRRRISIQNDVTPIRNKDSPPDQPPSTSNQTYPPKKSRRGRPKSSKSAKKAAKSTVGGPKAKRISSIPEEVFIESIQSVPEESADAKSESVAEASTPVRRGRGRPKKVVKPPLPEEKPEPDIEKVEPEVKKSVEASTSQPVVSNQQGQRLKGRRNSKTVPEVVEFKKPQPCRTNMRSKDASMRTTRAQDWKWENVLLTNPDKITRSRRK